MKKIIYIISFLLLSGIICAKLMGVSGQEIVDSGELVYHWHPFERIDKGNGNHTLRITIGGTELAVYKKDDIITQIAGIEDKKVIRYKVKNAENYIGIGNRYSWEDIFDIDADSFEYEILSNNFVLDKDSDTIRFRSKVNNKLVVTLKDIKVFDYEGKKLKIDKSYIKENKVIFKYNRADKSKKVKVDPTWKWEPGAAAGKDNHILSGTNSGNNYGTANSLLLGLTTGTRRILIQAVGIEDSISKSSVISEGRIIFNYQSGGGTPPPSVYCWLLKRADWTETGSSWDNYKTDNAWSTAGAAHADDIYININGDTSSATITWAGVDTVIMTNCVKQIAGVDSSIANAGFRLQGSTENDGHYGIWDSDDDGVDNPIFEADYYTAVYTPLVWDFTSRDSNSVYIDSVGYGTNDTTLVDFELILLPMMSGLDTLYVNTDTTTPFTFTAVSQNNTEWGDDTQVIKGLIPGYSYSYRSRAVVDDIKSAWSIIDTFTVQGTLAGGGVTIIDSVRVITWDSLKAVEELKWIKDILAGGVVTDSVRVAIWDSLLNNKKYEWIVNVLKD